MDPSSIAVARLMRVQSKLMMPTNRTYVPGQFYRHVPHMNGLTAQSLKVGVIVFRADMVAVAKECMPLFMGDRICTGPETLTAVEFLIGGRVGINASTQVVIDSERSVADVNTPAGRAFINALRVLVKWDAKALKQPLEIQTNGGTMAIKG
jgi:hypothetical protein